LACQSGLAPSRTGALDGIVAVVAEVVVDMIANGEPVPEALAEKHYSGEFRVRIPPEVHRELAIKASVQNISINRLGGAKLAA